MSVHKTTTAAGEVRYKVRWREGGRDGRAFSKTFDRKADADDFDLDMRRRSQLGAHTPAAPSRETLAAWLGEWWERDSHLWAASTRLPRAALLDKWVEPYLAHVRLKDLGPARVKAWRAEITRAGASANTANAVMRVLSAALTQAVEAGKLPQNPCFGIGRLKHTPRRARGLTPAEAEFLRVNFSAQRDRVLWGLLAYAGLRPEEALALRWCDIQRRTLVIERAFVLGEFKTTKTGRRRTVDLIGPLADDLALLAEETGGSGSDLILTNRAGGPLHLGNWRRRIFDPAAKAAGVEWATPYNGRDTFASLLIAEGRDPGAVSRQLGHADTETMWRHYHHFFADAELVKGRPFGELVAEARERLSFRAIPTGERFG